LKVWKLTLIISIILTTSGCAVSRQALKDGQSKVVDTYLDAVSAGRADTADYIRENFKINQGFGYVKPYVPVVEPADVRMVWIPPHKSKNDPNTLVAGHWVYIVVKESGWFIDAKDSDKVRIPLIVPYKEINKK